MPPVTSQGTGLGQRIRNLIGETGATLGDNIKKAYSAAQQTTLGQFPGAFAHEVGNVAREVVKAPVSVAMIPADLVSNIVNKKPLPKLKLPGVGDVTSYSRRAVEYQDQPGYTPTTAAVRAASEGVLDVASLGSVFKSAGVGNQNLADFLKKKPVQGTVEQIIESQGGWKPGTKVEFDTALAHKDAATIQKMLPDVPKEYQTRFSKEITSTQLEALQKSPESVVLYRGENPSNVGGHHFSTDSAWAKNFGDKMLTGTLPKGAKVTSLTKEAVDDALSRGAKNEAEVFDDIFKQGYDAIVGTDPMNPGAVDVIVNPQRSIFASSNARGVPESLKEAAEQGTRAVIRKDVIKNPPIIPREEYDRIRNLKEFGSTLQEIGDTYGVSKERIRQILETMPQVKRAVLEKVGGGMSSDMIDEVRQLRAQGFTYREIGEKYDVSRQSVQQMLKYWEKQMVK